MPNNEAAKPGQQGNGFFVPEGLNTELHRIKKRQKARKAAGTPQNVTNQMLYEMLSDVLENQARIENRLKNL